jgi:hypothetical protein
VRNDPSIKRSVNLQRRLDTYKKNQASW